ncbi:hypothetical protein [Steroidobacter denitrificans]|uniref:hypothetical protein n=1 Tax=Steroidobacter denitrificans TaxID=465721 RepID=UPI001AEFD71B|nr:hypothetical protein [Steroidobacter denitrificans]
MQQNIGSIKQRWDGWRLSVRFLALLVGATGVALIPGGSRLLWLGGTPYFLLIGLALMAGAVLLWQLRASGARLYGLLLWLALGWAVFATGSSPWPLIGRLALPVIMGSWLILPPVRRRLIGATMTPFTHVAAAAAAAVLAGFVAHGKFNPPPLDPALRIGMSTLPDIPFDPATTPVDWAHWGNDRGGTRHSRLTQITPQNVHQLRYYGLTALAMPRRDT